MNWEHEAEYLLGDTAGLSAGERLHRFFDSHWRYMLYEFPEFAYEVGEPAPEATWTDQSLDAIERRNRQLDIPVRVLESIDVEQLDSEDRLSHRLAYKSALLAVEGRRFPSHLLAVSQLDGPFQSVPLSLGLMPTGTAEDYERIVHRLRAVPTLLHQTFELLREGVAAGVTQPQVILRDLPRQAELMAMVDLERSPLLKPFAHFPPGVDDPARRSLTHEASSVIADHVVPAVQGLATFLNDTYVPSCRDSIALGQLPEGDAWYAHNIRHLTSTELSPEEIHRIGTDEVERIGAEMAALLERVGFEGTATEFAHRLRADPKQQFTSTDELVTGYQALCKRIDAQLVRVVATLPRLPYGVSEMPDHMAQSAPAAYYQPGSPTAVRAGEFLVNTFALPSRVRWEMVALALHEAVPGHHLQVARAQELTHLPKFRQNAFDTAYVEGWALYCERIGEDLSLYDEHSRFGRLTFEMWRAVRLVVDTGIHHLGWSRHDAVAYFSSHSGQAGHEIAVEVDRYIAWPAQALAYKLGELKLRELRAVATEALGPAFDPRAFHDEILGHGPLPLDVLEDQVRSWITARVA